MRRSLLLTIIFVLITTYIYSKPQLPKSIRFEFVETSTTEINQRLETIKKRLAAYSLINEIEEVSPGKYEVRFPQKSDTKIVKRLIETRGEVSVWKMYTIEQLQTSEFFPEMIDLHSLQTFISEYRKDEQGFLIHIKDTASVNNILRKNMNRIVHFQWARKADSERSDHVVLYALMPYYQLLKRGPIQDDFVFREFKVQKQSGGWVLNLKMDGFSARDWARVTGAHKGLSLAIMVDGEISCIMPVKGIAEDWRMSINNLTKQEAIELGAILTGGILPHKIKII